MVIYKKENIMNELSIVQMKEANGGIVDGGCVIGPKVLTIPKFPK